MNILYPDQIRDMYGVSDADAAYLYNTAAARGDFSSLLPQQTPTRSAAAPVPTGPVASPVTGRPIFRNEVERNMAIDTGAYDPNFVSPLWKAAYTAADQRRAVDAAASVAAQRKAFPLTNDLNGDQLLAAQLAGDRGDTKRVLQSLQRIDPETDILLPPDQRAKMSGY